MYNQTGNSFHNSHIIWIACPNFHRPVNFLNVLQYILMPSFISLWLQCLKKVASCPSSDGFWRVQFFRNLGNSINPLNAELNPICYLLALLGAHHFLHVSRIRVKVTFKSLGFKYPVVSADWNFLLEFRHSLQWSGKCLIFLKSYKHRSWH